MANRKRLPRRQRDLRSVANVIVAATPDRATGRLTGYADYTGDMPMADANVMLQMALTELDQLGRSNEACRYLADRLIDISSMGGPLMQAVYVQEQLDKAKVPECDPEYPEIGLSLSGRVSVAVGNGGAISFFGFGGVDQDGQYNLPF